MNEVRAVSRWAVNENAIYYEHERHETIFAFCHGFDSQHVALWFFQFHWRWFSFASPPTKATPRLAIQWLNDAGTPWISWFYIFRNAWIPESKATLCGWNCFWADLIDTFILLFSPKNWGKIIHFKCAQIDYVYVMWRIAVCNLFFHSFKCITILCIIKMT